MGLGTATLFTGTATHHATTTARADRLVPQHADRAHQQQLGPVAGLAN
ncbi:hypothetical protein [Streptomyces shaanxiensis]